MKNIWKELPKPIFALAPMEGVTDTVFRQIISHCGRPSLFFTEFTNVDGLYSKGRKDVDHRLIFKKQEKPLIAQIWGMNIDNYSRAAAEIEEMGFDGIDINMGCPEKSVVKRGACAGLIHNHDLVEKIITAIRSGSSLPLSVKTRIGIGEIETEKWIPFLLEQNIDALTVHLRTVREQSVPPPHWNEMEKIVHLRNKINPEILLLGNGDVTSLEDANNKVSRYGIDGIMIGRGIFHNPFLFNSTKKLETLTLDERTKLLLKHSALFEKTWGKEKNFAILKKFYKIYTLGLPNATEIRMMLMKTKNLREVEDIVKKM